MRSKWSVLGTVFILCFVFVSKAQAISINPARLTVTVGRGESQVISLAIRNDNKTPQKYSLGVIGASQDETGRPVFRVGSSDAETWVVTEKNSITIPAGKTQNVFFTASVPSTAAEGVAHYLGLTVSEVPDARGDVIIQAKVISLLELQVAGRIEEHGVLNTWQAENFFTSALAWPMRVSIANTGKGSAPLKGTATITSLITRRNYEAPVLLGSLLLPGTSRRITVPLNLPETFLPGIYSVKLGVVYGYTGQQLTRTAWVLYLPKYAQLIVVLVVALGLLAIFMIRRRVGSNRM